MKSLSDCYELYNGVKIPCVGYGTYKTPDGEVCAEGVRIALENGYRHIDTAEFYANEKGVGEGIRRSGIPRDEIFVTTKLWNSHQGYDSTLYSFDESVKKLGTDTADLYLVHWPIANDLREKYPRHLLETWRAFEELYKSGRVRAIGVCNCLKHHLNVILGECEVKPMVNQIEYHYGFRDEETVAFSKDNGMIVEGWAPLCKGRFFGEEPLKSVAEKYGKTEAQILVRYILEHGALPLPKSVTPARIIENANVFDFELSDEDVKLLDSFEGVGRLGSHPDRVTF